MSRIDYKAQEQEYLLKYYSPLVGMTITDIAVVPDHTDGDWGDNWLVIQVTDKNGKRYRLEVSQDPEGNGPGFIFGLPRPE
jgi:hypothetical protein